jgi:DeoR/GlpR family transcriptional regulator of sugar metabolism
MDASISLIVVTHSVDIVQDLRAFPNIKVIMVGGTMDSKTGASFGQHAIEQINDYNIDKAFLAVEGIDAAQGITNNLPLESDITHYVLTRAKKSIVVADHSKIGKVNFIQMGSIHDVDTLITDSKAPSDKIESIQREGVEVLIV